MLASPWQVTDRVGTLGFAQVLTLPGLSPAASILKILSQQENQVSVRRQPRDSSGKEPRRRTAISSVRFWNPGAVWAGAATYIEGDDRQHTCDTTE